jgi:hypothetical protein
MLYIFLFRRNRKVWPLDPPSQSSKRKNKKKRDIRSIVLTIRRIFSHLTMSQKCELSKKKGYATFPKYVQHSHSQICWMTFLQCIWVIPCIIWVIYVYEVNISTIASKILLSRDYNSQNPFVGIFFSEFSVYFFDFCCISK